MTTLLEELNLMHSHYIEAVNLAVADDDLTRASTLAHDYDVEAVTLIAEREGRTALLPQVLATLA